MTSRPVSAREIFVPGIWVPREFKFPVLLPISGQNGYLRVGRETVPDPIKIVVNRHKPRKKSSLQAWAGLFRPVLSLHPISQRLNLELELLIVFKNS